MKLGGWTDKIYSRYAIGAESEIALAVPKLSEYLKRAGWHSGGTRAKTPIKPKGIEKNPCKLGDNHGFRGRKSAFLGGALVALFSRGATRHGNPNETIGSGP